MVFEGHVGEVRKHEIYERAWVMALPSLKEGWGLVVGEAGDARDPDGRLRSARAAPGSRSSTACPALLVDDPAELTAALGALLRDDAACGARLGDGAPRHEPGLHLGARAGRRSRSWWRAALRGDLVDDQDADGGLIG